MTWPAPEKGFNIRTVTGADGAINEDLYCLTCGYNLRGLSGDPVRCPECGNFNDLGSVALPAQMVRRALRRMETAPTVCVAVAVLFFAFSATLLMRAWLVTLLLAILAPLWFAAKNSVETSFRAQPGWRRILLDFHLATLLCTLLIPLTTILFIMDRYRVERSPWLLLAIAVALAIPPFVWGLRIYYAARQRLRIMQRDAAVRLAQKILRRALHRH